MEQKPMHTNGVYATRPSAGFVIALPCSGSGAEQWRQLGEMVGSGKLIAPEHYGSDQVGPWTGEHAFTLADEAERTIALIDSTDGKVHLVGHSYGGGVALHAALVRPWSVASLALYEPSAFHLLQAMDASGLDAFAEIADVARRTGEGVIAGDYRSAAECFVDYWGGKGTWKALDRERQLALMNWIPKAPLDFAALIKEPVNLDAYSDCDFPVLLMCGEHTRAPSRLIAERLETLLADAFLAVVAGAGHMGPFTHKTQVGTLIMSHIARAQALVQNV
jgi:pimeloyl-ACP methyl ester carboxylesterase